MQEPEKHAGAVGMVGRWTRGLALEVRRAVQWLTRPCARVLSARGHPRKIGRGHLRTKRARAAPHGRATASVETQEPAADSAGIGASAGLAALTAALVHPAPAVRARALEVVCEFSDDRAAELLGKMLHDPAASVRSAAAAAAARVRAQRLVATLIVTVQDPDIEVRRASALALERLTGTPVPLEPPEGVVGEDQLNELRHWWKEHRLAELLQGSEPRA